ncbi:MAG: radical SAM protein [Spirochaetia bacterium]
MNERGSLCVYGPVPSRRLGRSLGIDLVPLKTCTYDCVYCQLGGTTNKTIERKEYVTVEGVLGELERKLSVGPAPDYISIAGSGEPTLNARIGDFIGTIKNLTRIPVAVLTNGSLLWMPEVQEALMAADLVLPSLDAGDEQLFRYVNRPYKDISFECMVEGTAEFTKRFPGEVWLEVFLLKGVTGMPSEVEKIAALVKHIGPARVQLNTVSRPPAEAFADAVSQEKMEQLRRLLPGTVELISENVPAELSTPSVPGATDADILALLSRRPCTAKDIAAGLGLHIHEVMKRVPALLAAGIVAHMRQNGRTFYFAKRIY